MNTYCAIKLFFTDSVLDYFINLLAITMLFNIYNDTFRDECLG